jgi:hypothetical protein
VANGNGASAPGGNASGTAATGGRHTRAAVDPAGATASNAGVGTAGRPPSAMTAPATRSEPADHQAGPARPDAEQHRPAATLARPAAPGHDAHGTGTGRHRH